MRLQRLAAVVAVVAFAAALTLAAWHRELAAWWVGPAMGLSVGFGVNFTIRAAVAAVSEEAERAREEAESRQWETRKR